MGSAAGSNEPGGLTARRDATDPGPSATPAIEPQDMAFARLYDLDLEEDPGDLDLYLSLARRTGGPILELGVGTGRIAVPLAAAGHLVCGLDRDPAMLARARARAGTAGPRVAANLVLIEADMLAAEPPATLADVGPFGMAIIALNSLLLLPGREAQAAAVAAMAVRLAPGGLAVVDVWLPDADDLARYDGRLLLDYLRRDRETGRWVTKAGSALYDAATGSVSLTTIYEESEQGGRPARWVRTDRLRLVGSAELRRMAEEAGLEVEVVAGTYELDPLAAGDERAILVARRGGEAGRAAGDAATRGARSRSGAVTARGR